MVYWCILIQRFVFTVPSREIMVLAISLIEVMCLPCPYRQLLLFSYIRTQHLEVEVECRILVVEVEWINLR